MVTILLALTFHVIEICYVNGRNSVVRTKLSFWHTSGTSEFILIPQRANCNSGKLQGLILHFSLKSIIFYLNEDKLFSEI